MFKQTTVFLFLMTLIFCINCEDNSAASETPEEDLESLPDPSGLRGRPRKPSYEYSDRNAYDSLSSNRRVSGRRPSSNIAGQFVDPVYQNSKYDRSSSKQDKVFDEVPAASEFGEYASESGYGHCSKVNASAVALLALLFLLNLAQDVIQEVIDGNARRKRSVDYEDDSPAMQFIRDVGLETLTEGLPSIIIPMMVKLSDTNRLECKARPLCEANAELSLRYGSIGKVVGTLLSNMASNAFMDGKKSSFEVAQNASYHGRMIGSCDIYEQCHGKSKLGTFSTHNINTNEL